MTVDMVESLFLEQLWDLRRRGEALVPQQAKLYSCNSVEEKEKRL